MSASLTCGTSDWELGEVSSISLTCGTPDWELGEVNSASPTCGTPDWELGEVSLSQSDLWDTRLGPGRAQFYPPGLVLVPLCLCPRPSPPLQAF